MKSLTPSSIVRFRTIGNSLTGKLPSGKHGATMLTVRSKAPGIVGGTAGSDISSVNLPGTVNACTDGLQTMDTGSAMAIVQSSDSSSIVTPSSILDGYVSLMGSDIPGVIFPSAIAKFMREVICGVIVLRPVFTGIISTRSAR